MGICCWWPGNWPMRGCQRDTGLLSTMVKRAASLSTTFTFMLLAVASSPGLPASDSEMNIVAQEHFLGNVISFGLGGNQVIQIFGSHCHVTVLDFLVKIPKYC